MQSYLSKSIEIGGLIRKATFGALLIAVIYVPSTVQAGPFADWWFGRNQPAYPVGNPTPVGAYSGYPNTSYMPTTPLIHAPQTVTALMPTGAYNTQQQRVPVTYYRPVTTFDPNLGTTVTTLMPCTSYEYQTQRNPLLVPGIHGQSYQSFFGGYGNSGLQQRFSPVGSNSLQTLANQPTGGGQSTLSIPSSMANGLTTQAHMPVMQIPQAGMATLPTNQTIITPLSSTVVPAGAIAPLPTTFAPTNFAPTTLAPSSYFPSTSVPANVPAPSFPAQSMSSGPVNSFPPMSSAPAPVFPPIEPSNSFNNSASNNSIADSDSTQRPTLPPSGSPPSNSTQQFYRNPDQESYDYSDMNDLPNISGKSNNETSSSEPSDSFGETRFQLRKVERETEPESKPSREERPKELKPVPSPFDERFDPPSTLELQLDTRHLRPIPAPPGIDAKPDWSRGLLQARDQTASKPLREESKAGPIVNVASFRESQVERVETRSPSMSGGDVRIELRRSTAPHSNSAQAATSNVASPTNAGSSLDTSGWTTVPNR